MARFEAGPGIVTRGLVLNLDAGDPDSYTRSQPPYVEVLVVAGGGGGGSFGGGGGAGGLIYNSAYQLTNAAAITVTVGAGGAGQATSDTGIPGTNGSNSVFGSLTAIGGGGGGSRYGGAQSYQANSGSNGGSGGGSSMGDSGPVAPGGIATAGQGNNGGVGFIGSYKHGGGGGAGQVGQNATFTNAGNGGNGQTFSISGTSTTYAGGGGGGIYVDGGTAGTGGTGGGGNGNGFGAPGNGVANTGGGGGGGPYTFSYNNPGGTGGSGIVIVRYPGLPAATGGTITYLNGYTIHTFTSSGTFTPYTWNDISGNNNSGSLVNGVGFNSYQNGGGFIFDGTDDYIDLQYAIIGGTGNFTVNQWIQADASEAGGTTFGNYPAGALQIFYGTTYMGMWLNNSSTYVDSPVPFSSNPVMITAIRSGTTTYFYQNGVLLKTGSSSANIGAANFRIGTNTITLEQFTGKVFVTQTYNRALSATEITQNFNAQYNRFGIGLPTNGLIVNLDANSGQSYPGTGTTWYDLSGTGNNATLANGVAFSNSYGGIFDFDGLNDYAYIADNATLDLAGDKSQGIWLYMDSGDLGKGILGKADSSVNGMALSYGWSGYGFQNIAWNSVNEPSLAIGGADTNNWYYVAGVQSGGTRYIYVIGANGFRVSSHSGGNHTWNNALNFTIGQVTGYYTNMKAGAVHVYNRALSAGEVLGIYATQKARFGL